MESLLAMFNKIQEVSPLPFFSSETVVVQNAGMQHWLNMSVANSRGIAMNIDYALPAQFLWKLLKSIASSNMAPDQSPYSREVLTWRIYHILSLDTVTLDEDFHEVCSYWQREAIEEQACFKRYQLSQKLADLFEQYLIFRPTWIDTWSKGSFELPLPISSISNIEINQFAATSVWQGKLWYILHTELPYNPVDLMNDAISNISTNVHLLPKRISLFAINAMAPMWLNFLEKVGQHTEVHFYHLNPCFSYWGDILTEKLAMKRLVQWTDGVNLTEQDHTGNMTGHDVGNPLLANLGQQGREFIALLQSVSTLDIDAFDGLEAENALDKSPVLQSIQQDILTLTDKRLEPTLKLDDSIVISSSHSALREVQALHDYLLHQFNKDSALTPKDVLVMCPQIEDFAPYVNAVFTRGWQDLSEGIPPLPCSIADRSSKDSDPIVAAFMELLSLPDSRFQVTHIYALLKLPAIQEKLAICDDDVICIAHWLERASVHWGLDSEHKNTNLNGQHLTNQFTWQQGLSRLIKGFAYGEQIEISNDQLLLPDVEGQGGELLGKLMLFIEQLQFYVLKLSSNRTATQWQVLLNEMLEQSFSVTNEFSINIIHKAITALGEYTHQANFDERLPIAIVRDFLTSHFSEPDTSRQFMVGQVTFCSMLPMRSIPFKVIAILGLNDGQFPRQRQPLAFDLMSSTPAMLGDRSRRGDDRYLFLEAIISARQSLYLSFQGKSIKTNGDKQPSIVLNELMEYLTKGYGWDFSNDAKSQLRQTPMQPFSARNYLITGKVNRYPSFDGKWLELVNQPNKEKASLNNLDEMIEPSYSCAELIKFFQHPSKWYGQKQLNLYFEHFDINLSDDEPFTADSLAAYNLREQFVSAYVNEKNDHKSIDVVTQAAVLSGKYGDTPLTQSTIEQWRNDSQQFADQINPYVVEPIANNPFTYQYHHPDIGEVTVATSFPVSNSAIVCFRSSTPKHKDLFTLYIHQLMLQLAHEQGDYLSVKSVYGFYFNTKSQKVVKYQVKTIASPKVQLDLFISTFNQGQLSPLLANGVLAEKVLTARSFEQKDLDKFWEGDFNNQGFGHDPYINYFWPECANLEEILPLLTSLFKPVYDAIEGLK